MDKETYKIRLQTEQGPVFFWYDKSQRDYDWTEFENQALVLNNPMDAEKYLELAKMSVADPKNIENIDIVASLQGNYIKPSRTYHPESVTSDMIRAKMRRLVEDLNGNEKYYIKEKDNYSENGYLALPLENELIQSGILGEPVYMTYDFNQARAFDTYEEAEKVAKQLISRTKTIANDNLKDDMYKDFDNIKVDYTLSIINQKGNVIKTFSYTTINKKYT